MNLFNRKLAYKPIPSSKRVIIKIELNPEETELLKAFVENQVVNLEEVQRVRKTAVVEKDYKLLSTIASKLSVAT